MSNDFYNRIYAAVAGAKVRSKEIRDEFDRVVSGFALLPTLAQLFGGGSNYGTDSGAANAYVVAMSANVTSLYDGLTVRFKASATNTGASTLNVNSLGAKNIRRPDGTPLQAGDITLGQVCMLTYVTSSTTFQLHTFATASTPGPAGTGAYTARRALAGNYAPSLATNKGEMLDCTSDLTLTFDSVVSLGSAFYCWVSAVGATVTVAASDSLTNWKMYPGEVRFFYCDGTTLRSKIVQGFKLAPAATFSFIEPPGYIAYDVFMQAPGGGGGGGRRGAAASTRCGGAGGGAGAQVQGVVTAVTPGATITVTVGATGTGGAAAGADSTDGGAGVAGGTCSFGTALVAPGGNGGAAGTAGASSTGGAAVSTTGNITYGGTAGGNGDTTGAAPTPTTQTSWTATGGGGGGSIDSGNTVRAPATGGISGSASSSNQQAGGTAGVATGGNGGPGNASTTMARRAGTGGGGGASGSAVVAGGTGGAGMRGGGGGGGGASTNGIASGAGGAGGPAYIEIVGVM